MFAEHHFKTNCHFFDTIHWCGDLHPHTQTLAFTTRQLLAKLLSWLSSSLALDSLL